MRRGERDNMMNDYERSPDQEFLARSEEDFL
jgi:hypothetical protein